MSREKINYKVDAQEFWLKNLLTRAVSLHLEYLEENTNSNRTTKALNKLIEHAHDFMLDAQETGKEINRLINESIFLKDKSPRELELYQQAMDFFSYESLEGGNSNSTAIKAHIFFCSMESGLSDLIDIKEEKANKIVDELEEFLLAEQEKESCSRPLSNKLDELLEILRSPECCPSEKISTFKEKVEENRPTLGSRILEVIFCILNGRRISEVAEENPFKPLKYSFWNRAASEVDDLKALENQGPSPK